MALFVFENLAESNRHGVQPYDLDRPERLQTAVGAIEALRVDDLTIMHAPVIELEKILAVHSQGYIEALGRAVADARRSGNPTPFGEEVLIYPDSLDAIYTAAGAGIAGVDALVKGEAGAVFVAARAPGHHAERELAMGFCVLSNAAIAARHAQIEHKLRVAVLDIDIHNGNGTESALRNRDGALFTEIYLADHIPNSYPYPDRFPLPAAAENVHRIGLQHGSSGMTWAGAFSEGLLPKIQSFKPELVIISAGFDCMQDDPNGGFGVVPDDIYRITRTLKAELSVPLLSFLEGGYHLPNLESGISAHLTALSR